MDDRGVPIIGYQLEKRKKDTDQWISLNLLNEPIEGLWNNSILYHFDFRKMGARDIFPLKLFLQKSDLKMILCQFMICPGVVL